MERYPPVNQQKEEEKLKRTQVRGRCLGVSSSIESDKWMEKSENQFQLQYWLKQMLPYLKMRSFKSSHSCCFFALRCCRELSAFIFAWAETLSMVPIASRSSPIQIFLPNRAKTTDHKADNAIRLPRHPIMKPPPSDKKILLHVEKEIMDLGYLMFFNFKRF